VFAFATRNRLPLIVFSVAFLIRFVHLIAYSSSPFFQVHIADALYHEDWALRILGGDIFSLKMRGGLYKAPLYPYFLALSYLISGTSNFLAMLLQVIMAALSCLLLFLIGKRYFSASAACVGALIYNFYFPAVYFSTEMEIPTLAIFLTLLSFYLLVESPRAIALVGSAVVFGLSLLALPTNFLLLPLYVLVLLRKHGGMKQGRGKAMLFAAVVFATVFPCTLRNLIVDRRLTLISANGGINLFIGNNAKYDETVYLQPGYAFEELYDEPRRNAGADAFAEIRTWLRWEDVARRVTFIVVSRPGHLYETPPGVRLERLDTIELPVSSSEIRRALAAGERPAEVPERVLEYIFRQGLYGARVPA